MRIVAIAERIYVDPSALLKLYLHEPESAAMSRWRARTRGPLPVSRHGRLELVNGICLAAFRGHLRREALDDALASVEEDFTEGRYLERDVLWRGTLQRAADISRRHTAALGCRSLDVLHVATALELGLRRFMTFDRRQRELARAAGLALAAPPAPGPRTGSGPALRAGRQR
jgi:predicted nucleic acid-binding protein